MKRAWSIGVSVLASWGVVAYGVGSGTGSSSSGSGMQTAVTVYDSCSQPASSVVITRELECSFDEAQACGSSGNNGVGVATNCTNYYSGWDTSGSVRDAFGNYGERPFLIVEEYDPSARYCGDSDGVINATAYLLDENCHVNRDGTASTKITLGRSLTIAQYSDPFCGRVESEAEVPFGDPYDRACANNATRYLYNGPTPPMSAVAVYEDSSCSQTPVKLIVTQGFVCDAERDPWIGGCRPAGYSLYSVASCTTDYKELASAVFGDDTPYVVVESYLSNYCGSQANSATVYVLDNACHADPEDATSFRATLTSDGLAIITTYADANCELVESSTDFSKRSGMCLPQRDCADGYIHGCAKRFSIGGIAGPVSNGQMTAITVYDGESCQAPAASLTFTRELTCTPQAKSSNSYSSASYASDANTISSPCEYNGVVSTLTDCTYYYSGWDTSGSIANAFGYYGERPYLIVEEYDPSARYCGDSDGVLNVTAYLLDEKCHANRDGTASSRITLGRSLTIAKYNDPNCENLVSQAEVPYGDSYDRECANNATRYVYNGPTPPMSAVAVYEDSSCSQAPVKLTMTQGFVCDAERDPLSQNCRPDGNSHYSVSSCTSDYKELATAVFGDGTMYVMVEEYLSDFCGSSPDVVTIYVMDNTCHPNSDDTTSFRATLASDGSATISTYSDPNCQEISSFTDFTKRAQMCLPQRNCADGYIRGCAKRFSIGDNSIALTAAGRMTSVAVYDGGSCQAPAASLTFTRELTCTPQAKNSNSYSSASYTSDSNAISPICEYNGVVNTVTDCSNYYSGWDTSGSVRDAFGNYGERPFLIVEEYDPSARYCGDSDGVINATAYLLDENCHVNRDGTASTKITLGRSLTIAQYSDPFCGRVESEAEVPFGDPYDRACANNATRYLYNGPTPPMSAVAVYEDSSCSQTPVKLIVTQGFVCDAERDPWIGGCRPAGYSLYSVASCTTDYKELATSIFGDDTPYVVVESYLSNYCGSQANSATVYVLDNACHADPEDATSFRATLTSDGLAIITTYADANCELVESSTDFSKRSGMCLPQRDCADGYIHGCAKRFTVGGLRGMASSRLMTAIAIYERSCTEAPLQVMAFPDSTCEASAMDIHGCNDWSDNWFYYNGNCITDSTAFTESKFGDAPYLLMEKYAEGTNCGAHVYTAAYRSDNKCHPGILEGTHFRVSLGDDDSLTLSTFPSGLCRDSDSGATIVTVGSSYINTGVCYNGTARFYANLAAFSAPVPSLDEYKTREQIMFPDWLWDPRPRRIFESD